MYFVTVDDPKNPDDDNLPGFNNTGFGYVSENFQMGQFEVTNAQYTEFLNSIAQKDDFHGLYNTMMGTSPHGGINRTGTGGSYLYEIREDRGKWPVNFVSFWDCLRFINWMHNGCPQGNRTFKVQKMELFSVGHKTPLYNSQFSAKFFSSQYR